MSKGQYSIMTHLDSLFVKRMQGIDQSARDFAAWVEEMDLHR